MAKDSKVPTSAASSGDTRRLRLNPLIRVETEGGSIELDLPLSHRRYKVNSGVYVTALEAIAKAQTRAGAVRLLQKHYQDVSDDEALAIVKSLLEAEIVAWADDRRPRWDAAEHWISRGWLEALLFHLACESERYSVEQVDGTIQGAPGATVGLAPEAWKRYPMARRVTLPNGVPSAPTESLDTVMLRRRSNLPWSGKDLGIAAVAWLLQSASRETVTVRRRYAATADSNPSVLLDSAYTALELYLVVNDVDGLEPGIYHYEPDQHTLAVIQDRAVASELQAVCVGQERAKTARAVFAVSALWHRVFTRYPQASAYRVVHQFTGELCQKLVVLSTALGLSTFITPAFNDVLADALFGFDPETESLVEVVGVG